ncbi:hypothetical protein D3C72_514060 [compost metagenome]
MELRVDAILDGEPLTLDEAKLHLRVDGAAENMLITGLISAVRQRCEGECKRALIPQRRIALLDAFPCEIGLGPNVTSILSVTYRDESGAAQTLASSAYRLVGERWLVPVSAWPAGDSVRITFECGAFAVADVPAALKSWMLLHIGAMFAQREAVASGQLYQPPGRFVDGLLDPYRSY